VVRQLEESQNLVHQHQQLVLEVHLHLSPLVARYLDQQPSQAVHLLPVLEQLHQALMLDPLVEVLQQSMR